MLLAPPGSSCGSSSAISQMPSGDARGRGLEQHAARRRARALTRRGRDAQYLRAQRSAPARGSGTATVIPVRRPAARAGAPRPLRSPPPPRPVGPRARPVRRSPHACRPGAGGLPEMSGRSTLHNRSHARGARRARGAPRRSPRCRAAPCSRRRRPPVQLSAGGRALGPGRRSPESSHPSRTRRCASPNSPTPGSRKGSLQAELARAPARPSRRDAAATRTACCAA